jgi:hypothetical protein
MLPALRPWANSSSNRQMAVPPAAEEEDRGDIEDADHDDGRFTSRNPRLQARLQPIERSGDVLFILDWFCDQFDAKRTYHLSNRIEPRLGCPTERIVEALAAEACRLGPPPAGFASLPLQYFTANC